MAERLLSDRTLRAEASKNRDKDVYLSDGGGLYARGLKSTPTGPGPVIFQYRFKIGLRAGYFHCGTYPNTSLAEARENRDLARKLVVRGLHPGQEERRKKEEAAAKARAEADELAVDDLHEDWQRVYLSKHRKDKGASVRYFYNCHVRDRIGKFKARAVTKRDVVKIIDAIVKDGKNRTANMALSVLKQMFAHGDARGIVDKNPVSGLTKAHAGGREKSRKRNLSFDELAELATKLVHGALPPNYEAAIWLLLATGVRRTELIEAPFSEIDDEKSREWRIPAVRTKNGEPHIVHLSAFALKWLQKLNELRCGPYLFPGRSENEPLADHSFTSSIRDRQRSKPLKGRAKDAKALLLSGGNWTPHDLRRTMSTRMGDLGVAPHVIEKCLNHKLEGMLAVYQHQEYLPERREAYERWGQRLEEIESAARAPI